MNQFEAAARPPSGLRLLPTLSAVLADFMYILDCDACRRTMKYLRGHRMAVVGTDLVPAAPLPPLAGLHGPLLQHI